MPRDYPSQAQTGLAKGLEGLFGGIQAGMQGAKDQELKKAYMDAMYSGKRDPLELENARQGNRMQLAALKAKNALDYLSKQGVKKGANPRAVGITEADLKTAQDNARRLASITDMNDIDEEKSANYMTALKQELATLTDSVNRRNRMNYGRELTPDELYTPDGLLATPVMTEAPSQAKVMGVPIPFTKTPAKFAIKKPGTGSDDVTKDADGNPLW